MKLLKRYNKKYIRLIINIIFFIVILFIFYFPKERFGKGFREGSVSPYNLYSPFDMVIKTEIDEEKTKKERHKARESILDVYDYNISKIIEKREELINFIIQLKEIKNQGMAIDLKETQPSLQYSLPPSLIRNLFRLENFDQIEDTFLEVSHRFLLRPIISLNNRQELLQNNKFKILIRDIEKNTINEMETSLLPTPESILKEVEDYLNNNQELAKIKTQVMDLFKLCVEPNLIYNQDITSKFRQEAEERIKPIYKEIDVKKDELILAKGQRVTQKEMQIIEGINNKLGKSNLLYNFLSIGIIVLIIFILAEIYLYRYEEEIYSHINELVFLKFLVICALLVTRIFYNSGFSYNLIPIPATAMLVSLLLGGSIAIKINIFISMMIALILELNFKYTVIFFIGGMVGALLVEKARKRSQVLKGGLGVGVAQFFSLFAFGLLEQFNLVDLTKEASFGFLNGIISAFIVLGSLYFFESLFRLISNITLLELSDTNHPLLKELIIKAPGTYHHSLVVSNLAESACEVIGANSLLARIGAYYHDVGKIDKAEYFSENQPHPYSKHIKLTPELSSLVIINHVKEGIEKAKKHKLNRKVIEIIEQHHGTGKVFYFYQQALLRGEEEKKFDEFRFCYPGPLPQTKEAAVVMLADSVEAASRALEEPNPSSFCNLVRRIINNKFVEGQLNDSNLTLNDLNKIGDCFINLLLGIYHSRIKYSNNDNRNNQNYKKENTAFSYPNKEKDY